MGRLISVPTYFRVQLTLEQLGGWGTDAPRSQKSSYNFTGGPPYPGLSSVDSTNRDKTIVHIY